MSQIAKDLREKRARIIAEARTNLEAGKGSAEANAAFDAAMAQVDSLAEQIKRFELADTLAADLEQMIQTPATGLSAPPPALNAKLRDYRVASAAIAGNIDALTPADQAYHESTIGRDRRILAAMAVDGGISALAPEDLAHYRRNFNSPQAAGSVGTNSGGGFTVAPLFQRELLIAMKMYGGMRQAARSLETETGASLPFPTADDTANVATIVTENTAVGSGTDLAFGQVPIGAFMYSSGVLPVSLQLLQDSAFDFEQLMRDLLTIRFARGQNAHFTNGVGTTQPKGITVAGVNGVTGAVGQTTSVIFDNLISLEHSVDPAYRPGARFMMHDTTLRALKTLKDSYGRYLWLPGTTVNAGDSLLGYPYTINQDMPVMAANAKSIAFGNFNNYIIRDVMGLQILALRERYADLLQVGFLGFMRSDGNLVSAAQPIKWYANSAA